MVRKLALAVSIAMGTLPLSVYGLGLGNIQTHSALNQNFSGSIELLSVPKGELDGIRVELADMEAFARAGIDRPFLLSKLRFEPIRLKNGKAGIRVTSSVPINEPFLDFLIELNWANGRLLREYTVLLDPPATTKRSASGINSSTTRTASTRAVYSRQPGGTLSGNEYGPVTSTDTLWDIAAAFKPEGVSIHQMMMALQKATPAAFINGNVNLLKKGSILRVPDANEINNIAQQDAVSSFNNQTEDWMSGTPTAVQPAASDSGSEAVADAGTDAEVDESLLRIAAASEGEEAGAIEGTDTGSAGAEELRQELMSAREEAVSARLEADDLEGQVSTLEERLDDLQRLLSLKDEQFAQLQAGLAVEDIADEITADAIAEIDPVDEYSSALETDSEETSVVVVELETQADDTPLPEIAEEMSALVVEVPKADVVEEVVENVVEDVVAEVTEQAAPVSAASKGLVGKATDWFNNNKMLAYGAGGGAVAIILGLLFGRRKSKGERIEPVVSVEEESILMDDVPAAPATPGNMDHDTSFLSEYSTEELKALQEDTAEVDPVSEADVYVAYGRYQQALSILRESLGNDTVDHTAVRYKILEVFFATQDRDQFVTMAQEMVESGQIDETSTEWQQVKTMGRDLDKSNPLFSEGVMAVDAVVELNSAMNVDEDTSDVGDSEMSLDLSRLAEELDSSLNDDAAPVEGMESLELDLSKFNIESSSEDNSSAVGQAADSALSELEVDPALAETELHTQMGDMSDLADLNDLATDEDSSVLDDELADLSGELEDVMADSVILDEPLEIDDQAPGGATKVDSEIAESEFSPDDDIEPESILGAEAETKLELAHAYIEMGDREGALSILVEVEEDGTDDQKDEASRMLSELNS